MTNWEIIVAIVSAVGGVFSARWTVTTIIKHENEVCDKRLEAFKEGLDRGER